MQKIWLVACDYDGDPEKIIQQSLEGLARLPDRLILVHIFNVPVVPQNVSVLGADAAILTSQEEVRKAIVAHSEKFMTRLVQKVHEKHSDLIVEVIIREGDVVDEILEVADQMNADRIIIGTHGRKGLEHFFLGSVAEKIIRLAKQSVFVAKLAHDEGTR